MGTSQSPLQVREQARTNVGPEEVRECTPDNSLVQEQLICVSEEQGTPTLDAAARERAPIDGDGWETRPLGEYPVGWAAIDEFHRVISAAVNELNAEVATLDAALTDMAVALHEASLPGWVTEDAVNDATAAAARRIDDIHELATLAMGLRDEFHSYYVEQAGHWSYVNGLVEQGGLLIADAWTSVGRISSAARAAASGAVDRLTFLRDASFAAFTVLGGGTPMVRFVSAALQRAATGVGEAAAGEDVDLLGEAGHMAVDAAASFIPATGLVSSVLLSTGAEAAHAAIDDRDPDYTGSATSGAANHLATRVAMRFTRSGQDRLSRVIQAGMALAANEITTEVLEEIRDGEILRDILAVQRDEVSPTRMLTIVSHLERATASDMELGRPRWRIALRGLLRGINSSERVIIKDSEAWVDQLVRISVDLHGPQRVLEAVQYLDAAYLDG